MSNPYHPKHSWFWFLKRPAYMRHMLREMTAVTIAAYLVFFLGFLARLGEGPEAFAGLLECLKSPTAVILHVIVLLGALYHSITWFNLTPRAMPVFIGENRAPAALVAVAMGYLPWAVVTALIAWAALG